MPRANYPMNLEGPNNVRDLGGYLTQDGKYTKWGQFLRSDNPNKITPKDCEDLYNYGVRLQVDLRSDFECEKQPSNLKGFKDIEYANFLMMDNMNSNQGDIKLPDKMSDIYIDLMDNAQDRYKAIFKLILKHADDCVLFNCTAGRDRTGTTAMLLLKIANCSNAQIIADYMTTDYNIRDDMKKMMEMFKERGMDDSMKLMEDPRTDIEETVAYFDKKYGTGENYLVQIGLTADEIAGLKKKLVG